MATILFVAADGSVHISADRANIQLSTDEARRLADAIQHAVPGARATLTPSPRPRALPIQAPAATSPAGVRAGKVAA
jgi:hypothetical protein